jgi:hypothetical protein
MKAKWTQKESELEQHVRKQAALLKQVCLALASVLQISGVSFLHRKLEIQLRHVRKVV